MIRRQSIVRIRMNDIVRRWKFLAIPPFRLMHAPSGRAHDFGVMSSLKLRVPYHGASMIRFFIGVMEMRRFLAISAATIALAVPSIATAGTPGFVDVSLGTIDVDGDDLTTMGVGGSVVAPLSGNWNVQFDGEFTRYEDDGLAVVAELVAVHQGTVTASNAAGGGARLTVTMPAAPAE